MAQPEIRYLAARDMSGNQGLTKVTQRKCVVVTITGTGADQPILSVPAGTYVRAFARIATAVDGTTPTVDIGIASDEDALIDNTAFPCATVNSVAESVGGIYFATAGAVTMDVTGTTVTAGEIEVYFELYDLADMALVPHDEITI